MQIKRVVRKIANAAMPSLPGNPAVLNADNAVGKLGDFVVVGNHYQRLMEFVAFGFQNPQYIVARPTVQIADRLVSQNDGGLGNKSTGDSDTLLLSAGPSTFNKRYSSGVKMTDSPARVAVNSEKLMNNTPSV